MTCRRDDADCDGWKVLVISIKRLSLYLSKVHIETNNRIRNLDNLAIASVLIEGNLKNTFLLPTPLRFHTGWRLALSIIDTWVSKIVNLSPLSTRHSLLRSKCSRLTPNSSPHSNGMIVDYIHYNVETKNRPTQIVCDNTQFGKAWPWFVCLFL